jgi:predicted nucleotidyltransferase
MIALSIPIPRDDIARICRRHGIRKLSLFGSVLRADFDSSSDIDVLVEFEPETRIGLRFFEIERELSELWGRKADLNTPAFLSSAFRQDVLRTAEVVYDAT